MRLLMVATVHNGTRSVNRKISSKAMPSQYVQETNTLHQKQQTISVHFLSIENIK